MGALAVSFRRAEIRWTEVAPQVGDADTIDVLVLDTWGIPQHITARCAQKWASNSWHREFACPACVHTARVLKVVNGIAVCRRCLPALSAHHRFKNCSNWTNEGAPTDEIIRSALKPKSTRRARRRRQRLAEQLKRNALSRAALVIEEAERLIKGVDSL
jgi:hypothetical protein